MDQNAQNNGYFAARCGLERRRLNSCVATSYVRTRIKENMLMRREALSRVRQHHRFHKIAAQHRGRQSQTTASAEKEEFASDIPRGLPASPEACNEIGEPAPDVNAEFKDSLMPLPPQLRRIRTTPDPAHEVRSKTTGIKHRDRTGQKHWVNEK